MAFFINAWAGRRGGGSLRRIFVFFSFVPHSEERSILWLRIKPIVLDKRHGFHAGDIKTLPAAHVFAHDLVVNQHHVTLSFLEFCPIALVGVVRKPVDFGPHQL